MPVHKAAGQAGTAGIVLDAESCRTGLESGQVLGSQAVAGTW